MKNPAERLLGGHVFGTLTEDERLELYAAALEDQDLFDALAEQEPLRDLLISRAVRKELLEALDRPTLGERLEGLLRRPATWADLAVAASALAVVLVVAHFFIPRPVEGPRAASTSPYLIRAVFALRAEKATPDQLRVEGARVVFRLEREGQAILAARTSAGALVQIFPSPGEASWIPAGRVTTVDIPHGAKADRIRLAIFPPEVDPLALDLGALDEIAPQVRVLEWDRPSEGDRAP